MDSLPQHSFLEFRPDTFETIRKVHNLYEPGRMKEAVRILDEWVKKQPHFKKKDFNPYYLETTIIGCKGSVERAKLQLDKICTYRSLLPAYFEIFDAKNDAGNLYDIVKPVALPKLTPDHFRVYFLKLEDHPLDASQFIDFYKTGVVLAEYLKINDYLNGFMVVADLRDANIMELVTKMNPIELKQALNIYMDGYGMRMKGIHILTSSKVVDTLLSLLKQVLSEKLSKRITVHKTIDTLYEVLPKEILPVEYGGEERSLKEILDKWVDLLSSKEHLDHLKEMNEATIDESCRQSDKFNEHYAGLPGTFRVLSVD